LATMIAPRRVRPNDRWALRDLSGSCAGAPPPSPLLVPVQRGDDVTQAVLGGARRAGLGVEEEDLLLDVGSQQQEVHELVDAGAREAQRAGQVGVVDERGTRRSGPPVVAGFLACSCPRSGVWARVQRDGGRRAWR
jgi:hypothetical protein